MQKGANVVKAHLYIYSQEYIVLSLAKSKTIENTHQFQNHFAKIWPFAGRNRRCRKDAGMTAVLFEPFRVHRHALVHARCVRRIALARILYIGDAAIIITRNGRSTEMPYDRQEVFPALQPSLTNGICCCVATLAIKIIAHVALLPLRQWSAYDRL